MRKFSLEPCVDPKVWDDFVNASPQGTPFCRTDFMAALDAEPKLWFGLQGSKPIAAIMLFIRNGVPALAPLPFTLYQGVLFSDEFMGQPNHRRYQVLPELLDFLMSTLAKIYPSLSFCLHPSLDDLRGLQWFHFQEPTLGRFVLELWYTGRLDLTQFADFDAFLSTVRGVRRQEYRKAESSGLHIEEFDDLELFVDLNVATFERQGIGVPEPNRQNIRAITSAALRGEFGTMRVCRTPKGEAASATLFLHDTRCAYYLFGGNDPKFRSTGSGSYLLLENIRHAIKDGREIVDFCGVNSPHRGDFKTSFGAVPTPYYVATWKRSSAQ